MSCIALTSEPVRHAVRALPLTQEEREEAVAMLADSRPCAEIVAWLGCTPEQVRALTRDGAGNRGCEAEHAVKAKCGPAPKPRVFASRAERAERQSKVLTYLKAGPARLGEISKGTGVGEWACDRLLRRLMVEGSVRKIGGGRSLPSGQKACLWALLKAEG